jgi:multiple sugar transport system substrate-binding protein
MEKKHPSTVAGALSRRAFLQATSLSILGTALAACAAPAATTSDGGDAATPDSEKVTLRLSYWGFEIERQGELQKRFMETHPDIQLVEEVTAWDTYWQKMLTSTAAGEAPDVMAHSPYYHVQYAANNVTIPLDPFIDRDGIPLEEYYEGAIAMGRWQPGRISTGEGDLHAFPTSWHSGTMWFYNKTVFEAEGIPLPDDTWTWDTLLDVAGELTKIGDDGVAELYGMDTPLDGNGRINSWIFQAGGDFYDPELRTTLIKSDEAMQAFQWVVDLVLTHKVALPPEPNAQFNPFQTGRVGIGLQGDWMITPFADIEEFEWNIFWPPAHPQTGLTTIDAYQNGYAITSSASNPDAAWEYVKWLVHGEGLGIYGTIFAGSFPAHIPTAEATVYVKDREQPPSELWILGELLKTAKPVFIGPAEGEISTICQEEQEAALLQTKSVAEATDAIEARVNAVLERAWQELT